MNTTKHILNAIGVGLLTTAIGWFLFDIYGAENSRQLLFPLFVTGIILYAVLELSGAHKSFCNMLN